MNPDTEKECREMCSPVERAAGIVLANNLCLERRSRARQMTTCERAIAEKYFNNTESENGEQVREQCFLHCAKDASKRREFSNKNMIREMCADACLGRKVNGAYDLLPCE